MVAVLLIATALPRIAVVVLVAAIAVAAAIKGDRTQRFLCKFVHIFRGMDVCIPW
jgi:hypothetical protein